MVTTSTTASLIRLTYRLKALRDQKLANRLLWLAAEGRLELLPDGSIGFWSKAPAVLELTAATGSRVSLHEAIQVDPTWAGPQEEAAIWGAADPQVIEAVQFDSRGCPVLVLREFTLKLRVEGDDEAVAPKRPRRKGPARLYPRLARPRAA